MELLETTDCCQAVAVEDKRVQIAHLPNVELAGELVVRDVEYLQGGETSNTVERREIVFGQVEPTELDQVGNVGERVAQSVLAEIDADQDR